MTHVYLLTCESKTTGDATGPLYVYSSLTTAALAAKRIYKIPSNEWKEIKKKGFCRYWRAEKNYNYIDIIEKEVDEETL